MKQKKLSLQQKKTMVQARSHRGASYDRTIDALVIVHRGKTLDCLVDDHVMTLQNSRTFDIVVGDRVVLGCSDNKEPELIEHCPRKNVLYRITRDGTKKALAANIDLACVVVAAQPEPWPQLIAQYLTHLENLNIDCCFIFNKCDQAAPPEWLEERLSYLAKRFSMPVLKTSAHTGIGMDELQALIANKTSIIMGPSGVGKSSLLKKLINNHEIRVGDLSSSAKGQHTTSVTQLYHISSTTSLIDSPGIRQLAMEGLTLQELLTGFKDFSDQGCRFKDCDHVDSKGCAVFDALKQNIIPQHRYDDYLYLRKKFLADH